MKIIELHDKNNPTQVIPLVADSFELAVPYLGGAGIKLKSSDAFIVVHETPEEIIALLQD